MKNKILIFSSIFIMLFSANVIAEPSDADEFLKIDEAHNELIELTQEANALIEIIDETIIVSELEASIDNVEEAVANNQATEATLQMLEAELHTEIIHTEERYQEFLQSEDESLNESTTEEENPATQESEAIDELITIVTNGEYDRSEATKMVERLQSIYPVLYQGLIDSGVKMYLVNFPITELEQFSDLAGKIPAGWENEGKTWDDVPGAGGINSVARIGYSEPLIENSHGSFNLELHEIGHPVDQFVLGNISDSAEFKEIHQAEQLNFLPDVYFDAPSEYFAEAFSYYFLSDESRNQLRVQAPRTYSFFQSLSGEEQPPEPSIERLTQAIEELRAMDDSLITEELYNAFDYAITVRDNPLATQEEIDTAEVQLREAMQFAVSQPKDEEEVISVDKNLLNTAIDEAIHLVEETSPTNFINALDNAYIVSQDPYATQEEVDTALENLATEIANAQSENPTDLSEDEVDAVIHEKSNDSESEDIVVAASGGSELPSTATHTFNYIFVGLMLIILGITTMVSRKLQPLFLNNYLDEKKFTISR
ncbi:anthrax toxin lethal factor-related metalloendopeptidase [Oceanobacillus sp. CAU 1775]